MFIHIPWYDPFLPTKSTISNKWVKVQGGIPAGTPMKRSGCRGSQSLTPCNLLHPPKFNEAKTPETWCKIWKTNTPQAAFPFWEAAYLLRGKLQAVSFWGWLKKTRFQFRSVFFYAENSEVPSLFMATHPHLRGFALCVLIATFPHPPSYSLQRVSTPEAIGQPLPHFGNVHLLPAPIFRWGNSLLSFREC